MLPNSVKNFTDFFLFNFIYLTYTNNFTVYYINNKLVDFVDTNVNIS